MNFQMACVPGAFNKKGLQLRRQFGGHPSVETIAGSTRSYWRWYEEIALRATPEFTPLS
jgi:hypothetical protein